MGLDSLLAGNCSGDSDIDHLAREVSEGAAFLFDSAVWVAFLGGVCRPGLAATLVCRRDAGTLDSGRALIEQCIPQNIGR